MLEEEMAHMSGERIVQTWYRCVMVEDGSVWCESLSKREVLMAGEQTSEPVRFESYSVVQWETPWGSFLPSEDETARAKEDAADEDAEMTSWAELGHGGG